MPHPETLSQIAILQDALTAVATPATRTWWERYLKGVIPFRGAKMGQIRKAVHTWYPGACGGWAPEHALELALELIRQAHAEDKLAGTLLIQEILIPNGHLEWSSALPQCAALFQNGFIADWNTCDWFCIKVLGTLAEQNGEPCARAIADWRSAETVWQRRASGVAFVYLAANGDGNFPGFVTMLLDVCAATVQSSERFAQTGTGWVLREIAKGSPNNQERVIAFIEEHAQIMSSEGLRYATEKMEAPLQKRLRAMRRRRTRS